MWATLWPQGTLPTPARHPMHTGTPQRGERLALAKLEQARIPWPPLCVSGPCPDTAPE